MQKTLSYATYLDKVYGAFLGKTVIGTLGAPFEGIKMPMALPFDRAMIDAMLPNDDLDLQVLWLDVVERHGPDFTSYDLHRRFCACCDYSPGEYAMMRKNYHRGIYPPLSGSFSNDFYIHGMGCPIRSEIWGCLSPLDPARAADFASRDGVLDHKGDSVYAEQFLAALESAAFFESDLNALLDVGLRFVPRDSRFYELVCDVRAWCAKYGDVKRVLRKILHKYGHPDCTNMYENMGIALAALLLCDLDLIRTGMAALNCGFDTDCTCATVGAVIGLIEGAEALMAKYELSDDVRFVLGVRSARRSDRVKDLAEDIALLGSHLSGEGIVGAPETAYTFAPSQFPLRLSVTYANDDPTVSPDEPCRYTLHAENLSDERVETVMRVSLLGKTAAQPIALSPKERVSHEFVAVLDAETKAISDKNMGEAVYMWNGEEHRFAFGVVGAMPWKVVGPIWRTDPICNTELLMKYDLKYGDMIRDIPYDGHRSDIKRCFHLNFAIDTDSEYMAHDACFTPFDEEADTAFEESVWYQKRDAFSLDELCGFRGPCVFYLSREVICPEDWEGFVQVGHSAPFCLWINGERMAERKNCDTWDAENVHLEGVKLHRGVNRVLLRLTRVNADAKFNLSFSNRSSCGTHYVELSAVRPEYFS